jgi:hypothetical protein
LKNQLKAILLVLAALLLPTLSLAQTGAALTQTTTVGITAANSTFVQLTSVTGITGFGANNNAVGGTFSGNGNTIDLYIDRELMQVVSVNTPAKSAQVIRGVGGSQASAHPANSLVLAGPAGSAFFNYDPEGYCGGAVNTGVSPSNPPTWFPWVNQRTSLQWLCSGFSLSWVPGFGNPGYSGTPIAPSTTVASASTILPSGPLFHVTGATALVTFTQPVGCNTSAIGACSFTIIMDSVETWTAAGNISTAGTNTTAGTSVTFTWNPTTSKWMPSRLS